MKKIDLIIFDCDGVLVDSEMIANRVSAKLKTEFGFPITTEENIRKFIGLSSKSTEVLEIRNQLPANYPQVLKERRDCAFRAELKEIPGVTELLKTLRTSVCVASSGDLEKIHLTLGITDLYRFFEGKIFSSQMVERGKPFPDLFLLAANKMGVAPENCLVIEDSVPGIRAAVAAGMSVLGFVGGSHIYPELSTNLKAAGAVSIFSEMQNLQDALIDANIEGLL